jgi:hypothetical protein
LQADLFELDLQVQGQEDRLVLSACTVSWTRSARRAKIRGEPGTGASTDLICVAALQDYEGASVEDMQKPVEFVCTWRRGTDRQHFESLFSHLIRKLAARPPEQNNMDKV